MKVKISPQSTSPRSDAGGVFSDDKVDDFCAELAGAGVPIQLAVPDIPEDYHNAPLDLPDLPSAEVSRRQAAAVACATPLNRQLTLCETLLVVRQKRLRMIQARILSNAQINRDTKKYLLENGFYGDPEWVQVADESASLEAKAKLLKGMLEDYRSLANLMSREISRREPELRHLGSAY